MRFFLRWMKAHTANSVQAQLNKRADIVARDTARGCYPLRIGTVDSWRLKMLSVVGSGTLRRWLSWMPRQLAARPQHGLPPWTATVNFSQGLKWMTPEDTLTSSYELAWLWWHRCKWHPPLLHGDKEAGRFSSLLTWCRMVLRYEDSFLQERYSRHKCF